MCIDYGDIYYYHRNNSCDLPTCRGGTKTKNQSSLSISNIFWPLILKIIVVLAENQYLGRFKGGYDVIMTLFRPKNGFGLMHFISSKESGSRRYETFSGR